MFRKRLAEMLLQNPMSVSQIARQAGCRPQEILTDLQHLIRSSKHADYKPIVDPAVCQKCGFEFGKDKLTKPSKCPKCRSTWLIEPLISFEPKATPPS